MKQPKRSNLPEAFGLPRAGVVRVRLVGMGERAEEFQLIDGGVRARQRARRPFGPVHFIRPL